MSFLRVVVVGLGTVGLSTAIACSGDSFSPAPPAGTAGSGGGAGNNLAGGTAGGAGSAGAPSDGGAAGSVSGGAGGTEAGGTAGAASGTGGASGNVAQGGTAGASNGGSAGVDAGGSAGSTSAGSAGTSSGGSAGTSSGGSAGTSAGGTSGGGSGGSGGTAAGAAGSAGAGGSTSVACTPGGTATCDSGEYCPEHTKVCTPCTDLSRVVVGPAADLLSPSAKGGHFYPRVVVIGGQFLLTYREGADSPFGELFAAFSPFETFQSSQVAEIPAPISQSKAHDSALFVLGDGILGAAFGATSPGMDATGFRYALFDSDRSRKPGDLTTDRKGLYVARLPTLAPAKDPLAERLGAEWNDEDGVNGEDFSPVYAEGTQRLYWMRKRTQLIDTTFAIVSRKIGLNSGTPKALTLAGGACAPGTTLEPGNYAPWVTPDGRHLFYSQLCRAEVAGSVPRSIILHVGLAASGLETEGPTEVVDTTGGVVSAEPTQHRSPSLSPDQCRLYWERDGRLTSAPRK